MKKLTPQQKKTKLRKNCVQTAKAIVKHMNGYRCEKCGVSGQIKQLQGSHIYPEGRYSSMSADLDNILCLCAGCHMWSSDSWHENPLEASEWFRKKYPKRYETLKKRSRITQKINWENKLGELKSIYIELIN